MQVTARPRVVLVMDGERHDRAVRDQPAFGAGAQRVAVCAADEILADRIGQAVTVAGHELVGRGSELSELIEEFPLLDATVVVVAVRRGADPGQLAQFGRRLPGVPLIAVVPNLRRAESGRLLSAEIDGLVLVDEIERALGPAIASVLADQLCVPVAARHALAGPVFSHREKQVLKLLLAGLTNSEIAGRLYLSESTVKSHLSSSFRKLGVSSRAEVLRRARSAESSLRLPLNLEHAEPDSGAIRV